MENLLYDMSLKYQQDFLSYIQKTLQEINIPTLIHGTEGKSFPYIILSFETVQEVFRGRGTFFLEVLLLQNVSSHELEGAVAEKLYILSRMSSLLVHEIPVKKWNSCTGARVTGKQKKETKQHYSTHWGVHVVSNWRNCA